MNPVLSNNNHYSEQSRTLHCSWNCGFFSNCTVTLWGLVDLYNLNKMPERIDFSSAFSDYRTQEQIDNKTNLHPLYFRTDLDSKIRTKTTPVMRHDHHGIYRNYDFDSYNPFIQRYFNLSESILDIQNYLVQKYSIKFEKTIAVCYRGTDKHIEVKLADPRKYLSAAEYVLGQIPDARILIQTDQKQVRELFTGYFGDKCFYFDEMPVNEDEVAVHKTLSRFQLNGFEFGKMVLATTHLLSNCRAIINHTGNVASWICLFRGNAEGVLQFDREGKPVM